MEKTNSSFQGYAGLDRGLLALFYLIPPKHSSFKTLAEVPDYVSEAIPYFVLMIGIEVIIRWCKGLPRLQVNDSIISMATGLMMFTMKAVLLRGFEVGAYAWVHNNFRLTSLPWDSVYTWLLCFLVYDLCFYWFHRAAHEINLFWAAHQVHHSSEYYNTTTALRQSFLQRFYAWFFFLPMALFIPPTQFLVHDQLNLLYQFWIHTEVVGKLGPLEYIMNTPSHHRVHHGRNKYCIDRNYGGVLIIWDKMFGTFEAEDEQEPVVFGIVDLLRSFNPLWAQLQHFFKLERKLWTVPGVINKIFVFIKGPGWTPGSPWTGAYSDEIFIIDDPTPYQKDVPTWVNMYCFIHYIPLLVLSMVATGNQVPYYIAVSMVAYIFLSLTNLGLIFEHNQWCAVIEVIRLIGSVAIATVYQPHLLIPGSQFPDTKLLTMLHVCSAVPWTMVAMKPLLNRI